MVRLVEVARDRSSGEFFVRGAEGIRYFSRKNSVIIYYFLQP